MGLLSGDSRGQLFSLDLLFALIPLVLVLGMVASDMDNITYLIQDTVYRSSTEKVAADTLNTLLETSGDPPNWEENGTVNVAGLAQYDFDKGVPVEGTVASSKLSALNVSHVQNIVGNNYGFYLNVTTIDDKTLLKSIGTNNVGAYGAGINSTASDIVRVEKVANYGKLDIVSSLKNGIRDPGQPRIYTSPPDPFPTNNFYLDIYDYYVLVVNRGYDSATIDINGNTVVKGNDFQGKDTRYVTLPPKLIDESFMKNQTSLQPNSVKVRTVSNPGASMDVYIIRAPKGTPESDITLENVNPRPCRVILFLWTN
ncbi:hypothetical protein [Methanobacterium sp.]|uniref:hypothetical protein n=1 Tax=Methanobacterium sp. TaxID=2164 RepID=UPI003C75CFA1